MKKKVTNDDVSEVLGKIADKIRSDMDFDFRVAESQMGIAENDLRMSLNEEQLKLYEDYRQKRDAFYRIAGELYTRKF